LHTSTGKGKAIPIQAYYRATGFRELEAPRFPDNRKVVSRRLWPPLRKGSIPGTHF